MYLTLAATCVRAFGTSRGVFRYAERLRGHDLALRMQSALRLSTYDNLSRRTLLGGRQGDMLMRVTADVEAVMDVVVRVVLPFCSAAVVVVGTSLVLAIFDPASAAVLLGCSVLAGIGFPLAAQRASLRADSAVAPLRADLADEARQAARCAADLVAYDAADAALDSLSEVDSRLRQAEMRAAWTRGLAAGGQLVVMGVAVVAALLLGGRAVVSGDMLARDLAVLCLTPLALHESFADLTKAAQTLTVARASLARVSALLAGPEPAGHEVVGHEGAPGTSATLGFDNLAIGWPGHAPVLAGLELDMAPRERVAVTGPSGVGKTTLAATIMGLLPAVGGELRRPERVGYLAQDAHIFATTVAENVRIGNPKATDAEVSAALDSAGLPGIDPQRLVGDGGQSLSGGESRRLALARLLATGEPYDLVILDEPTEHLDQETATALLDDLWRATAPAAVLAITHDPEVVSRCARELRLGQPASLA
jgi:ATP-binding cassette subfamily C protein CydCD